MGKNKKTQQQLKYELTEKFNLSMQMFVDEYLRNGRNAQAAYQKLHPECSHNSAGASASRMLKNVNCRAYLALKEAEYKEKYEVTKEFLIENLKWAVNDAKSENDKKNLIKATEVLAKMCGLNAPEKSEVEITGLKINYVLPTQDETENEQ